MKRKIFRLEMFLFKNYFYFDDVGFWFLYKGDEVGWIYPWNRIDKDKKWISLFFSGTGQFGDSLYKNLKDIDNEYEYFYEASKM